jgi:hypothetical protein
MTSSEKKAEQPTLHRARYESFGWSFSGGLLSVRPVREAARRLTALVTNALASLNGKASSAGKRR